ncbi:hydroxyacid dehydrogenase [Ramlibacter sp. G-1-2-2]|uniref:Hydroxyacid dehydrogenase n=1 Tax=Ramlibacter agri TaxID=2728837 RepID=A0A848H2N4_9BURK|nr:hydroxyacid dehydrogenase [Ramlibacter agri]
MEILLLERLAPDAQAWLEERHAVSLRPDLADADTAALRRAVYKAQAVVLSRKALVTREFLDFAPMLKAVARLHVSSDNTDLEACRERRVRVIQASSASLRANAEYLLAGLLSLFRRGIGESLAGDRHAPIRLGRELHGSVLGLLGLAPSAHPLAIMLQSLGVKLIGYDPAVHQTAPTWRRLGVQPVTLDELVAHADAVAVQVLYASRYRGFVNDKVLAHCKPGQVWVSNTRSDFFDPHALARALTDGRIEAALLDSAEAGFASQGSPLHERANLFLTPRLGSYTRESRQRASWYVAQRIHETLTAPSPSMFDGTVSGLMGLLDPGGPETQPSRAAPAAPGSSPETP